MTATLPTLASAMLLAGLLVLAGIGAEVRPARAQAPLDCPLPPGVTAPSQPSVSAQQVEDGSASLMAFALAARASVSRPSMSQAEKTYAACLYRQEGSAWHSGSTYLVSLTPDGRVLGHAANMSLSDGLLDPVIYEAILQALGIDAAVLRDRAAAVAAFRAAIAGNGGPFEVPAIPRAAGYATAYDSALLGTPIVLLAGFELDPSHLVDEPIEHIQPAVTAGDVVDRASLKAFVDAAGEYILQIQQEGLAAISKARLALRDPDGPWRHGSVYLVVVEPESRIILFHGALPDQLELRQAGIYRDVVTGELIADRFIAAAESGPQGGFLLYHFDDPADDSDSADIPKVSYARLFNGNIPLPDGGTTPASFIINSGFYRTPESVFVQRILEALKEGQTSILFGTTTPEDGDVVAGDAVAVSVSGAPTDTVHFAYRPAGLPEEAYTWLGAAPNREAEASFAWDTLDLPDDDYELVALYTEDDGKSVVYDAIEVSVDNVGGGGGCVAVPLLPGGPVDPTLSVLVGLLTAYLMLGRRRPRRQAALG